MTIETKIAKNGSLTLKKDGQRSNIRDVKHSLYLCTRVGTVIKTAEGKIFTCTNPKAAAPSPRNLYKEGYEYTDENGERYFFSTGEEALNRIAKNNFQEWNFFEETINTTVEAMLEAVVTPEAQDVAIEAEIIAAGQKTVANYIKACDEENAKKYEAEIQKWFAMSTPQVTPEAQDAAVEAETKAANAVAIENEREALIAELKADGYKFIVTTNKVFFGENNSTSILPTNTYVKTFERAMHELKLQAKFYANNPAHDGGFELATIDSVILAKGDKIADFEQNLKSVENTVEETATQNPVKVVTETTEPTVDELKEIEREEARREYCEFKPIIDAAQKEYDRVESLRNRCKDGSPKRKAYNQQLAQMGEGMKILGKKYAEINNRYTESLLPTEAERTAAREALEKIKADYRARGIKFFATVYYFPHGYDGEDMKNFRLECKTFKEAADFIRAEEHEGKYVGGIYEAGYTIEDIDGNLIADQQAGDLDALIEKYDAASFDTEKFLAELELKAEMEAELQPAEVKALNKELRESDLCAPHMCLSVMPKGFFPSCKLKKIQVKQFETDKVYYNICYDDEPLEVYDTFEQVTAAIQALKAAIENGCAERFTLPTADELNAVKAKSTLDKMKAVAEKRSVIIENLNKEIALTHDYIVYLKSVYHWIANWKKHKRLIKRQISCGLQMARQRQILLKHQAALQAKIAQIQNAAHRDSLARAMKINLEKIQQFCREHNLTAASNELKLYNICSGAMRDLRKEERLNETCGGSSRREHHGRQSNLLH